MNTWHLIIDVENCQDCNNCLIACKDEFVGNAWPGYSAAQPLHGHRWINIVRAERGQYPLVDMTYLPTLCMHCDTAPCIAASGGCITKRKDGVVIIDPQRSRGKKELLDSCPYGAISWNEQEEIPQKCTGCAHLLDTGWKEPRCVQVCPTGALRFEPMEDADFAKRARSEELEALHPEYKTRPRVLYKNMHRFTKYFIAGTVVCSSKGVEDCVGGAEVRVFLAANMVAEERTDTYGEFKVDHIEPGSGPYTIEIEWNGSMRTMTVRSIVQSVNVGVIVVGPDTS